MPNINDINGVTVANLAKLDAVLKANISKVNGLSFAAAAFLLDTYTGAAAAYSIRLLRSAYSGPILRVRRTSDDVEADVGFDNNNELSLTSPISNVSVPGSFTDFADFVNHTGTPTDARLAKWYDQSGNSNDAQQTTTTLQAQVYDSATGIVTENGKPALFFDGTATQGNGIYATGFGTGATRYFSYVARMTQNAGGGTGVYHSTLMFMQTAPSTSGNFLQVNSTNASNAVKLNFPTNTLDISNTTATNVQHLLSVQKTSTDSEFWIDNVSQGTSTGTQALEDEVSIGKFSTFGYAVMHLQELVVWNSDQDGANNRTGIETDINSDYLIYQPTDAPTSGLLATYTGAAAAYSVRQLSDKAVIAMRIRRDSDDEERNIGWDANGDLDTTAISDFCQTANGYVVEWADQSTNGNHATQSTAGNQPQIYNGAAVLTENGKPALDFDGVNDTLSISYTSTFTNISAWSVHAGTDGAVLSSYPSANPPNFFSLNMASSQYRNSLRNSSGTLATILTGTTTDVQVLQHFHYDRSNLGIAIDGATLQTASASLGDIATSSLGVSIGASTINTDHVNGTVQEVLLWNSDESSNRTGIESDINGYFSIYT